jgi:hypothetical protein
MAWTDAEKRAFQILNEKVDNLTKELAECCNKTSCGCECKVYPHYDRIEGNYFFMDTDSEGNEYENHKSAEELGISHDKFPEPACVSEKAIMFMTDAVLFCHYHKQDGWAIFEAVKRLQ